MKEHHVIPFYAAAVSTGTGFTEAVDAFTDASLRFPIDPFSFGILSKTVAESKSNNLFKTQHIFI